MTRKILGLFVSTLTTDDDYSLLNRHNLMEPILIQLSKKQKPFCQFVSAFLKWRLNFEQFEKNMTLIAFVFLKIQTTKGVVR